MPLVTQILNYRDQFVLVHPIFKYNSLNDYCIATSPGYIMPTLPTDLWEPPLRHIKAVEKANRQLWDISLLRHGLRPIRQGRNRL